MSNVIAIGNAPHRSGVSYLSDEAVKLTFQEKQVVNAMREVPYHVRVNIVAYAQGSRDGIKALELEKQEERRSCNGREKRNHSSI